MRATVSSPTPTRATIVRVLQRVEPSRRPLVASHPEHLGDGATTVLLRRQTAWRPRWRKNDQYGDTKLKIFGPFLVHPPDTVGLHRTAQCGTRDGAFPLLDSRILHSAAQNSTPTRPALNPRVRGSSPWRRTRKDVGHSPTGGGKGALCPPAGSQRGSQRRLVQARAGMELHGYMRAGWYLLDSTMRWLFGTPPASDFTRVASHGR